MEDIRQRLALVDNLIRDAKLPEALRVFQLIEKQKLPREFLLEASNLARRLNRPFQILKWLHRLVRPDQEASDRATDAETALYAIGLVRIGAYREAKDLLESLPVHLAEAQLGLIHLNGFQWNYRKMIRPLRRYMRLIPADSYAHSIARLNLLTALVDQGNWGAVDEHAEEFLRNSTERNFSLLKANALETYAQSKIQRQDYTAAVELLNEAGSILRDSGSRYDLFVKKWKLIIKILRSKEDCASEVHSLQREAQTKSEFETVRELDFYFASARHDEALFQKVYHGTRFEAYRRRMKQKFEGKLITIPKSGILFSDDTQNLTKPTSLSLADFDLSPSEKKMLKIVLSDFYRPIQLGEAFRDLYPNEYFNPNSSKNRLYKVFAGLKQTMLEQDAPLTICWKGGEISWARQRSFGLIVQDRTLHAQKNKLSELQLENVFSIHAFTERRRKSKRTCERELNRMIDAGLIRRIRPGYFKFRNSA